MKLQVKQLDECTANSIAFALEMYACYVGQINENRADTYRELAVLFRHSISLLVSEGYDAPVDDVQVLGKH